MEVSHTTLKLKRRDLNSQLEHSIPLRVLKSGVTLKVRYAWLILGECGRDVNISGSTCQK